MQIEFSQDWSTTTITINRVGSRKYQNLHASKHVVKVIHLSVRRISTPILSIYNWLSIGYMHRTSQWSAWTTIIKLYCSTYDLNHACWRQKNENFCKWIRDNALNIYRRVMIMLLKHLVVTCPWKQIKKRYVVRAINKERIIKYCSHWSWYSWGKKKHKFNTNNWNPFFICKKSLTQNSDEEMVLLILVRSVIYGFAYYIFLSTFCVYLNYAYTYPMPIHI